MTIERATLEVFFNLVLGDPGEGILPEKAELDSLSASSWRMANSAAVGRRSLQKRSPSNLPLPMRHKLRHRARRGNLVEARLSKGQSVPPGKGLSSEGQYPTWLRSC